ncbi:MAG: DUF2281 domain-containing protein [Leptolyngbya sp. Prado105]|jgi:hypothetical protein|nr:DUF2281 domain-containing protein [Leptolyngbya sp. Prado105]
MTIEQAILEKVRSLSPDKQQKILDFAESLVQEFQTTSPNQSSVQPERSLADFYGICADDPIVIDGGGISDELDDDMEGVFD